MFAGSAFEGKTEQEIFFSRSVCHPSTAINELSGPVVASALMKFLKGNYRKHKCNSALVAKTIGSLADRALQACLIGDEHRFPWLPLPNTLKDPSCQVGAIEGNQNYRKSRYKHHAGLPHLK